MNTYETQEMPTSNAIQFIKVFDERVGTDREINTINNTSHIVCMDLTPSECSFCKSIEESVADQKMKFKF